MRIMVKDKHNYWGIFDDVTYMVWIEKSVRSGIKVGGPSEDCIQIGMYQYISKEGGISQQEYNEIAKQLYSTGMYMFDESYHLI